MSGCWPSSLPTLKEMAVATFADSGPTTAVMSGWSVTSVLGHFLTDEVLNAAQQPRSK